MQGGSGSCEPVWLPPVTLHMRRCHHAGTCGLPSPHTMPWGQAAGGAGAGELASHAQNLHPMPLMHQLGPMLRRDLGLRACFSLASTRDVLGQTCTQSPSLLYCRLSVVPLCANSSHDVASSGKGSFPSSDTFFSNWESVFSYRCFAVAKMQSLFSALSKTALWPTIAALSVWGMKPGGFEVVCFALKTYLPGVPHPSCAW